ncbi:GNAT family N-acetyltransferase [Actinoallomurus iriomotensis]|uniref:N-acetyltransferase n=1 Tax=Actinoallomurus iriomotensis TaxID=478107 RepID=A0A9W6RLP1_9ACTN|nr:GNAT family protein [Actinoallomurus iriomotensis]GLY76135.1 N-acetyltransferase [Actinoallomurus iriomotensis]
MLSPELPIKTERLLLRRYTDDDLADLAAIQSRPDVTRYLYWGPRDLTQARGSLAMKIAASALREEGDNLTLAVELPETGKMIGDVQLFWISEAHRQGEIGYIFHPDYGGHGYATEAAEVILRLAFEELGLHRVTGRLDARNTASARVLERLGMRREAHLVQNERVKGEWVDEVVYAILEDEWRARHTVTTGPR